MKSLTSILFTLVALSFLPNAQAKIADGFYKHDDTKVLIKTTDGDTYAFFIEGYNSSPLFHVEELEDGTQSWVPLLIQNNVLAAAHDQMPIYAGTQVVKGGKLLLMLNGQNGTNLNMVLKSSDDYEWLDLPAQDERFKTDNDESNRLLKKSNVISNRHLKGTLGTFIIRSPVPSVGVLYQVNLNAESSDGRALARTLGGLVVRIKKKCLMPEDQILINYTDRNQAAFSGSHTYKIIK